ncbi:MAG: ABC transporter substrate-binding protein [Alphaproteobacteria bacterium]|nr:ABC transporter substrate-binding protein [Alphaproteobacteria bacterium]
MKKINWKSIVGWGIAALVAGFIVYTNMQEQKALQETGKKNVYAVLPLTGGLSYVGQEAQKAIQAHMASKDKSFNVIFIDSQSQTSTALTSLLSKTLNEKEPIVLSILTSATSAILSGAPKNSFIFGNYITSIDEKYKNYQLLTGELNEVMSPIKKYLETAPIKKIAVVYIEDDFGLLEAKYLEKNIRSDQKITQVMPLAPKSLDTRIEALKLMKDEPDAICILGIATIGYTNIIKSLREQGYKGTIIADYAFANPHVVRTLKADAEGIIAVTAITDTNAKLDEKNQQVKDTLARVGLRAYTFPIQIWDTLDLIQYSLDNNLPLTQETYTKMGKWNGISGEVIFPGNGHSLYPFVLVQYKNGEFVPVEK